MATGAQRELIILPDFFDDVRQAYEFILSNSYQNAEQFADGIEAALDEIETIPERYVPDRLLRDDANTYRRYIYFKSFKIVYAVEPDKLVVRGLTHVRRKPEMSLRIKNRHSK